MRAALGADGRGRIAMLVRSEFVQQIVGTFGTRVGLVVAGVATSVLIARSLGPEGRGTIALAGALTAIAIQLGNLGLHASNTWAVAKDPKLLPSLVGNSILVSVIVGGTAIAAIVLLGVARPDLLPVSGPLLSVALLAIPIGLSGLLMQNLLLGMQQVRDYNVLELGGRIASIAATVVVIALGLASPLAFLVAGTSISLGVVVVTIWRLWQLAAARVRTQLGLLRLYAAFGLRAYSTALVSFLVIRFDLFLVNAFRGVEAVGQYSIAVSLADLVYTLPVVVGTLLFPRLARMSSALEQVRYTRAVAIRLGALMILGSAAAAVLAEPAVEVLYGTPFLPAVPAFLWLLPGIVALSVHTILMNYVASVGLPAFALVPPVIGLLLNLPLNIVLLPVFGIIGASLASTVAYLAMLVTSSGYFRWNALRIERQAAKLSG